MKTKSARHVGVQLAAITIAGLVLLALSALAIILDWRLGLLGIPIAGVALFVLAWIEHRHQPPTPPRPCWRRHGVDREFWRHAHEITQNPYARNRKGTR